MEFFFWKGCDDHQVQLCLVNAITAGWGKKEVIILIFISFLSSMQRSVCIQDHL